MDRTIESPRRTAVAVVLLALASAGGWALLGRPGATEQVTASQPADPAGPTTTGRPAPTGTDLPSATTIAAGGVPPVDAPATTATSSRPARSAATTRPPVPVPVPRAATATTTTVVTVPLPPAAAPAPAPVPATAPTTTPVAPLVAPLTATSPTTTWVTPRAGYKGEIWMRLSTAVPGDHTVDLRWGAYGRLFAVSAGAPVTYHFEKQDADSPHRISLSADFDVTIEFGEGTPPGAIDARGGWYGPI
jgi:hypothetical protein